MVRELRMIWIILLPFFLEIYADGDIGDFVNLNYLAT